MAEADRVQWGETEIQYRVTEGAGRTLAITVHPDLSVEVKAPPGTPAELVRAKVLKRAAWIARTRRGFEKFQPLQPARRYVPGESHRYLGRQYRLKHVADERTRVSLQRGMLVALAPTLPPQEELRALVQRWYRQRAEVILPERFEACLRHPAFRRLSTPPLSLRSMQKRWGSCTRTGRILLNPELVKAPKDCIDYVITHELCHLIVPDHGPRFWRLLSRALPDWSERREALNRVADR